MTYQEALNYLNNTQFDMKSIKLVYETSSFIETCKKAIEKQIPKKPKETDAYPHRLYCPYCKWTFCYNENANSFKMMHMFRYCPECGQAIDWSDE